MRRLLMCCLVGLILEFHAASGARAQSPAEMLERGVYNEETVGNLDEAIRIYRQVISTAQETRGLAARAQYRLGHCLLKQGDRPAAMRAFEALVKEYPGQAELVAKARELLPGLRMQPAPWKDGEQLTLTMKLAGGQRIGIVGLSVTADQHDGRPAWRILVRRFVTGGLSQGVSRLVVDRETNRPRLSRWDHTVLGTTTAVWDDEKLVMTAKGKEGGEETETRVDLVGPAYANDQTFYAFRMLPLAVGYKTTIPLRVAFTGGNAVGLEVTVAKKETIETPAGSFNCFRLETNISQTFWIADNAQRYVARFEGAGVVAELSSIRDGSSEPLHNQELGLGVTVPEDWFFYRAESDNPSTSGGFYLVAPEMAFATVRAVKKSLLERDERESPRAWAEGKIKTAKDHFKEFTPRPGGTVSAELAGLPAVRFSADHLISNRSMTSTVILAMKDTVALELGTSALADQFEACRQKFAEIERSISLK